MQVKTVEKARAVVGRTTAQIQNHQGQGYHTHISASRANLLQQAADTLLLLQLPLSVTSRLAFWALLDRRLRRAYSGGRV
jgi:hypothetical protein